MVEHSAGAASGDSLDDRLDRALEDVEAGRVEVLHDSSAVLIQEDRIKRNARIKELEDALARAIEVIEWCGQNDKTPTYSYGKASDARRPDGSLPGPGKAFNTPREFASWWPERLRDVLDGGRLVV